MIIERASEKNYYVKKKCVIFCLIASLPYIPPNIRFFFMEDKKNNWLSIAEQCFKASNDKQMHVNDMAEIVISRSLAKGDLDKNDVATRLSASLSKNSKQKRLGTFRRVKGKKGQNKKGIYALRKENSSQLIRHEGPSVKTNYTGKAGEHSVLSELLFRGYNASIMTVDEGIDVVASKSNKYFHIQVKTANGQDNSPYTATIRQESFQLSTDIFYIIVLRRAQKRRFINDYIVFSSNEIRRLIFSKVIKEGANINFRISVSNDKFFLNGNYDVTQHVNDFESIT
jgi:hypothetical protein